MSYRPACAGPPEKERDGMKITSSIKTEAKITCDTAEECAELLWLSDRFQGKAVTLNFDTSYKDDGATRVACLFVVEHPIPG